MSRRRMMLENASGGTDIPIGVDLNTEPLSSGYYRTTMATAGIYYNDAVYPSTTYSHSEPIPINTNYTFTSTGGAFASAGAVCSLFLDENKKILHYTQADNMSVVLSRAISYETSNPNVKVKYFAFSVTAGTGHITITRTS